MVGPGRTLLVREPHAGPRPAWRGGRPPRCPRVGPRCELRGLGAPSSGSPRAARNFPALRGGAARARGGSERVAGGAEPRHGLAASCDASRWETSVKRSIGVGSDLPRRRNLRRGCLITRPVFTCVVIASLETVPGTGALFKAGVGLAFARCFGWDSDTASPGCPSRSGRCTAARLGLPE